MALVKPTLSELELQVYQTLSLRICGDLSPSLIPHKVIGVLSRFIAFIAWSIYEFSDRNGRTLYDAKGPLLDSYARMCGVTRLDSQYAGGCVSITGASSAILPKGTKLKRCDGKQYETVDEYSVPGEVKVIADERGSCYNTPNGVEMILQTPFPGVNSVGVVGSGSIAGGSDQESTEQYRQRVISCWVNPCRNGVTADYNYWTRLYNGVTRVCVHPKHMGPGTVKVYFAMDDVYSDGIPSQQDVVNVQNILDANVPDGICVTACAVSPVFIDVDICLIDGSTVEMRQLIVQSISESFQTFECQAICKADIIRAISDVYQGCFELKSPLSEPVLSLGQIPVLGTVNYVTS